MMQIPRILHALACAAILSTSSGLRAADGSLPTPLQAVSSKASLIIYADVGTAEKSAVWKAIAERTAGLASQFTNMASANVGGMPMDSALLKRLEQVDVAELLVVAEMKDLVRGVEEGALDASDAFLVVGRLAKSVDAEGLINEVLGLLEQQHAGASNQLAAARTKVGAADFFELPAAVISEPKPPFPLALAFGQAEGGGLFGLGRADRLKTFLEGKAAGQLPPGTEALLPQRGQMWVYVALPADAGKGLGGNNPMMAGMSQGLEKVRELGLSLGFGTTQIDVEVALGCVNAAAADEMLQGLQGVLGMMKMMASQSPGGVPGAVTKLNAAADGTSLRIRTAVTMQDVELALKNSGINPAARSSAPVVLVENDPPAAPCPLEVEFIQLVPSERTDLRYGKLRLKNTSAKAIKDMRVTYEYLDDRGTPLSEWTRRQTDPQSDILVRPQASRELECKLFQVPLRTAQVRVKLHEVTLSDGEVWQEPAAK